MNLEIINLEDQSNYRLNEIIFLYNNISTNIFARIKKKKKILCLITSIFSLIFSLSFRIIIILRQKIKIKKKKLINKLL